MQNKQMKNIRINIENNIWGNIINIAHDLIVGLKTHNDASCDSLDAIWTDVNRNIAIGIHNPIQRNIHQTIKKTK